MRQQLHKQKTTGKDNMLQNDSIQTTGNIDPAYHSFYRAYNIFNRIAWGGRLPYCMIRFSRRRSRRRLDLMPCYTWFMDANGGHYLILWLNGYFRNDLSDITPVVFRLWQLQNTLPLTVIDSIPLSMDNPEYSKIRLSQFLHSLGLNQTVTANWHQRTFGMSRLR